MSLLGRSAVGILVCGMYGLVVAGCDNSGLQSTDNDSGNGGGKDSGTGNGTDSGQQQGNDSGVSHDAGSSNDAGTSDAGNRNDGGNSSCQIPTVDAGNGGGAFTVTGPGGYPASHLAPPVEVYGCDRLLYAPKIVTVTFPNEASLTKFEGLGDSITATPWWDQVSNGYCNTGGQCITRGAGGGHVELTTGPAGNYTDSAGADGGSTIRDFIRQHVASGAFPMPDDNTLYVIYFPASTTITLTSGTQTATSCTAFGGYHSHVPITTPNGTVDTAYAIIPQCLLLALTGMPTTVAASHEIIEAATDPLVSDVTANGYYMDQSRDAWLAVSAAEVGDVCALLMDFQALVAPQAKPPANQWTESGYVVQRSFSNTSLLAGHDPCVPTLGGPYFSVAPANEKLVMSNVNDSKTIQLTGFSDGPVGDWNVQAVDFGYLTTLQSTLAFQFDRTTANNGTVLNLTVTVKKAIDPKNGAPFAIVSYPADGGNQIGFWPGIVETQ